MSQKVTSFTIRSVYI